MEDKKNFRYLVRIKNTDLDGNKQIVHALTKIKGVGCMYANAICKVMGYEPAKKAGYLTDNDMKRFDEVISEPLKFGIPTWMLNRRNDPESGDDMHILTSDHDFIKGNDIKLQKRIKSNRGMRHAFNLPVRGQKTKSNFRKSKSTGKGGSLGVKRKKGKK